MCGSCDSISLCTVTTVLELGDVRRPGEISDLAIDTLLCQLLYKWITSLILGSNYGDKVK
jgi:hypothetical protein